MSIKFSAIIPSFNRWPMVGEAVRSVLSQTAPPHEVIVVDDGSTDNTADELRAEFGSAIRVISKENGGVSTARNAGVDAATGSYVAYLDSDDLWEPNKLELTADALERLGRPTAFLFSDFRRFETSKGSYYPKTNTQLFPRIFEHFSSNGDDLYWSEGIDALRCVVNDYPFFPSTFIVHREIHAHFRWDPSVRYSEDFNFVAKIVDRFPMIYLDLPFVTVRMHGNNKSYNSQAKRRSHLRTLRMLELSVEQENDKRRAVRRALGRRHMSAARTLVAELKLGEAASHIWSSLRCPEYYIGGAQRLLRTPSSHAPSTLPDRIPATSTGLGISPMAKSDRQASP